MIGVLPFKSESNFPDDVEASALLGSFISLEDVNIGCRKIENTIRRTMINLKDVVQSMEATVTW
jgi:hypothetical protein